MLQGPQGVFWPLRQVCWCWPSQVWGGLFTPPPFPPGPPSAEPEIHPSALGVPLPGLPGRPCGKGTQTPVGDLAGEGAAGMTLRCLGNHMPGAVWLWCLDQTLRRELLQSQSRSRLQHKVWADKSGSGPFQCEWGHEYMHRPRETPGSAVSWEARALPITSPCGPYILQGLIRLSSHCSYRNNDAPPTPLIEGRLYTRPSAKFCEILHLILTTTFYSGKYWFCMRSEKFKVQLFT